MRSVCRVLCAVADMAMAPCTCSVRHRIAIDLEARPLGLGDVERLDVLPQAFARPDRGRIRRERNHAEVIDPQHRARGQIHDRVQVGDGTGETIHMQEFDLDTTSDASSENESDEDTAVVFVDVSEI